MFGPSCKFLASGNLGQEEWSTEQQSDVTAPTSAGTHVQVINHDEHISAALHPPSCQFELASALDVGRVKSWEAVLLATRADGENKVLLVQRPTGAPIG